MTTKKNSDNLYITAIGGLEEVGKNMMVVEYRNEMIIIDCGIKFPKVDTPGVDYLFNDFSYIIENRHRLLGLVVTHGHLDHIGAIPLLLEKIKTPIYCTTFTQSLIESILERDRRKKPEVDYHLFEASKPFSLGSFRIEGIRVNHSIIRAVSLAVKTPVGTIIHTGDWRIDEAPKYEKKIDIEKFKEYGKEGVLALFSDSTNAVKKAANPTETKVSEALENVFLTTRGRIIIATFSTQLSRIKEIMSLANIFKRKVAVVGRSMNNVISIAMDMNFLEHSDLFIELDKIKTLPPNELVVITTGSQGEKRAGLQLMALDTHRTVKLTKDDTVILSSSFIPGNENSINVLLNQLYKKEVRVITNKDKEIHTSGHASEEDLKAMIDWVKPAWFIPIHGETIQLVSHKRIAMEKKVPEEKIILIANGDKIEIAEGSARVVSKIKLTPYVWEGFSQGPLNRELMETRLTLSQNGVLCASIYVKNLELVSLDLDIRGCVDTRHNGRVMGELRSLITDCVMAKMTYLTSEQGKVEKEIKRRIEKYMRKNFDKSPLVFLSLFVH